MCVRVCVREVSVCSFLCERAGEKRMDRAEGFMLLYLLAL